MSHKKSIYDYTNNLWMLILSSRSFQTLLKKYLFSQSLKMASVASAQPIILFWSEYSQNCAKLRGMMSPQHLQLFEKVCIDAPSIREAIMDSVNLNIQEVPCFLFLDQQGQIRGKFEGQSAFRWFESVAQTGPSAGMKTHQPPQYAHNVPSTASDSPIGSSVDKILGGMKALARAPGTEFQEESAVFQGSRVSGAQARHQAQITRSRPGADLGRFPRGPSHEIYPEEEDEEENEGHPSNLPVKGAGHDNMISSLSGFGRAERQQMEEEQEMAQEPLPSSKMVAVGKGKRTVVIEDFSPNDETENQPIVNDDDPSGMSIPRGDVPIVGEPSKKSTNADQVVRQGTMGGRGGDKSKAIKDAAASMAASRQAEMESQSEKHQGRAQTARGKAKKTPVSLAGD